MDSQVLEYTKIPVCAPGFILFYDKRQGNFVALPLRYLLLLGCFRPLGAVFAAALHTAIDALCFKRSAYDMITYARKVLDTAAADHNYRVFLKVMSYTGNVSSDFVTIGKPYTCNLTKC